MIIDPSGRGPTRRQLLAAGASGLVVLAVVLGFLMARYVGWFVPTIDVTANMTSVGDGLPEDADVKFRGVLIGAVKNVSVTGADKTQRVHIEMRRDFEGKIPANVTARVVPSNLFAVSAIEFVYNGPDTRFLRTGSRIEQDRSDGTVTLQATLTAVQGILGKIDPVRFGRVLDTLSTALDGSGRLPGSTVERVDRWLRTVRASIPDFGGLLDDFATSFHALDESAPELMATLADSVRTARTIAERRAALADLIVGGTGVVDEVNDLFARNPEIGKEVTAGTSDTFGGLAADPGAITRALANLNDSIRKLNTTFHWGPQRQQVWNVGISFTPWRPNTVADCPRYGALAGPSCYTAPAVADPGTLPESLRPRHSVAAQLPVPLDIPPNPFAGTPLGWLFPASAPVASAPRTLTDDAAIGPLLGRRPTTAEWLLLRPMMRGVRITESVGAR
ncbi:MCE family protein [Nocardia sp. NPDC052566]|uniref:MCE family protein n=1 Tax=Nocardia sp. NPDC052566 TaxID=3364330 RepID=UPI0037C797C6